MTTEAIPKLLFIGEDTEELMDKRLGRVQVIEQKENNEIKTNWLHKFKSEIPLSAGFTLDGSSKSEQQKRTENTSIFNAVYSQKLGRLIYNSEQGIAEYNLQKLESIIKTGVSTAPVILLKQNGSLFLSPSQSKLLLINENQVQAYSWSANGLTLIKSTVNPHEFTNACWQNEECVYLWSFEGGLYNLRIKDSNWTQIISVSKCTGVTRMGANVIAMQIMQLFIIEEKTVVKNINLASIPNPENVMFQFMCIIGLAKLNNYSSSQFQASDCYALITVYYTAYDEGDEEPCHRYAFFLKGDLFEPDELAVRGNDLLLSVHDKEDLYLDSNNKSTRFGFSCAIENFENFVVVLVEKLDYLLLFDSNEKFEKLGVYSTWPKHGYKISSDLSKTNPYLRSICTMSNMLDFEKQAAPNDKLSKLYANKQFGGQFLRVYFSHKEADLTIEFPASIICLSDEYMFRKYAACTVEACQQEKQQEIVKFIKERKKSRYILPVGQVRNKLKTQISSPEIKPISQKQQEKKQSPLEKIEQADKQQKESPDQQNKKTKAYGEEEKNNKVQVENLKGSEGEKTLSFQKVEESPQPLKKQVDEHAQLKDEKSKNLNLTTDPFSIQKKQQSKSLFSNFGQHSASATPSIFDKQNTNPFAGKTMFNTNLFKSAESKDAFPFQQPMKKVSQTSETNGFTLQNSLKQDTLSKGEAEKKPFFGIPPGPSLIFGGPKIELNKGIFQQKQQIKQPNQNVQAAQKKQEDKKKQTNFPFDAFKNQKNKPFQFGSFGSAFPIDKTTKQEVKISTIKPKQQIAPAKLDKPEKIEKVENKTEPSTKPIKPAENKKQNIFIRLGDFAKQINLVNRKIQSYESDEKTPQLFNLKNVKGLVENWNKIFEPLKDQSFDQIGNVLVKIDKFEKQRKVTIKNKEDSQKIKKQVEKNYKQIDLLVDSLCYFVSFFESTPDHNEKKSIFGSVLKKPTYSSHNQEERFISAISKRVKDIEKLSHALNHKYKHELASEHKKNMKKSQQKTVRQYRFDFNSESSSSQYSEEQTVLSKLKSEKEKRKQEQRLSKLKMTGVISNFSISQALQKHKQKMVFSQNLKPVISFVPLEELIRKQNMTSKEPETLKSNSNVKQTPLQKPFDSKLNSLTGKREEKKVIPNLQKVEQLVERDLAKSESQNDDFQIPSSSTRTVSKAPMFGTKQTVQVNPNSKSNLSVFKNEGLFKNADEIKQGGVSQNFKQDKSPIIASFGNENKSKQKQEKTNITPTASFAQKKDEKSQQKPSTLFGSNSSATPGLFSQTPNLGTENKHIFWSGTILENNPISTQNKETKAEGMSNAIDVKDTKAAKTQIQPKDKNQQKTSFLNPISASSANLITETKANNTGLFNLFNKEKSSEAATKMNDNLFSNKITQPVDNLFSNKSTNPGLSMPSATTAAKIGTDNLVGGQKKIESNPGSNLGQQGQPNVNLFNNMSKAPNIQKQDNIEKQANVSPDQKEEIKQPSLSLNTSLNNFGVSNNPEPQKEKIVATDVSNSFASMKFNLTNQPKQQNIPNQQSQPPQQSQFPQQGQTSQGNQMNSNLSFGGFGQQNSYSGHASTTFGGGNRFMNPSTSSAGPSQQSGGGFNPNQMKFGSGNSSTLKSFSNFGASNNSANPFNQNKSQNTQSWVGPGFQPNNQTWGQNNQQPQQQGWINQNQWQVNTQQQQQHQQQQQQQGGLPWMHQPSQNPPWMQQNNSGMSQNNAQMHMPQGINASMMQPRK